MESIKCSRCGEIMKGKDECDAEILFANHTCKGKRDLNDLPTDILRKLALKQITEPEAWQEAGMRESGSGKGEVKMSKNAAEQPDYKVELTRDERQMVESLLGSAMDDAKEAEGGFSEEEYGILEKAHKKVVSAKPTHQRRRSKGVPCWHSARGIREVR